MMFMILAAAVTFGSNMSQEEKKQTGIAKLTIQERATLQEWIEEHYAKKVVAQNKGSSPVIEAVLKRGRFIRLSDETLWEIDPQDTLITQSWITPSEINVAENTDDDYPYSLTNSLTGSKVRARKAKKVE